VVNDPLNAQIKPRIEVAFDELERSFDAGGVDLRHGSWKGSGGAERWLSHWMASVAGYRGGALRSKIPVPHGNSWPLRLVTETAGGANECEDAIYQEICHFNLGLRQSIANIVGGSRRPACRSVVCARVGGCSSQEVLSEAAMVRRSSTPSAIFRMLQISVVYDLSAHFTLVMGDARRSSRVVWRTKDQSGIAYT
jgi:hypothetical protein